jgi:3-hydroxymyristoyl/3-hydroxydecanoyl-(acyl carrier protein) dehydratase
MKFPQVLLHTDDGDTRRFTLDITDELVWFLGHFPGYPVLPGVVQLRWAVELSQQHFGFEPGPLEIMRLKFKSIIVPPLAVELELRKLGAATTEFAYSGQGLDYSQGKLIFAGNGQ